MMARTLAQKLIARHTDEKDLSPGNIAQCRVSEVLANDITGPLAIASFKGMGADKVFDRERVILVMDHFTPQKDIDSANQVKISRQFAKEQNLVHYYEGGSSGVEHALLPELGIVKPGDLVIGADSHTCTYGGIGAFATGMGSTDIAAAMALGETWLKIPPSIRVIYKGELSPWAGAKDLILLLIGQIGVDGALYQAIEFSGPTIAKMPVEGRLTMANMAIEAGAKAGLFPVDETCREFCAATGHPTDLSLHGDDDASYAETVEIDVSGREPVVAMPHIPSNVHPVSEVDKKPVHQVVIGSCTNGRISDMRLAAKVLKGRKVNKDVRCIVLPATPGVWRACIDEGLMTIFMDAGCIVGPPTCGPCLGGHMGILGKGERCVSTTNRNFRGRMGELDSEIILANPAVAAASAVAGHIASPESL